MKVLLVIAISFFSFSSIGQSLHTHSSAIYDKLTWCKLEGIQDSLLCGQYAVFENRKEQTGRKINLNIVVIPALHRDSALAPIFYLEGGPGVAATNNAAFFADKSIPYRQYHDIVLVDIRGTGKSNPLNCASLQIKQGLEEQFDDMYPAEAVKECYDSLSKIADLKQYTTTNIAADLENVREWLEYKKINLYALSYGNRVALVYMKMFPSSIESCILWSPLPTYARMPLYHAQFAQNSLDKIFNDCKTDSLCNKTFPKIESEFRELMQKSKESPFQIPYTDDTGHKKVYSVTWNTFETKLRTLMYAPNSIRQIPYIIHQAYRSNWKPYIELYPQGIDTSNFIAEGLYLCVTCSEDVPYISSNEIDSLTTGTFMGTYRIDQQVAACTHWLRGEIPNDFFNPTNSDIPTLILSGSFDPVTPTSIAEEIASHLSHCTLVRIPYMSHTFDGLSHPECFDDICLRFIHNPYGKNLNFECVKEMLPNNYKVED